MNQAESDWKWFFFSWMLPIIGGLVTWWKNKESNKALANICLTLSILNPLLYLGWYLYLPLSNISAFILIITFIWFTSNFVD
jgi:hypothetical protein